MLVRAGEGDDVLDCLSRTISLRSAGGRKPRYETISYCWGDSSRRKTLLLDRRSLSVPANTAAALRCMRLSNRPRTMWIDAVSINQQDEEERGQQVALMGAVYESSHGNLIYLGEDNGLTEQAFQSVGVIVDEIRKEAGDQDLGHIHVR